MIGAGHNGLTCAAYLARAGLSVTVLERSGEPGGCIHTVELPDGRGRLEVGAYEVGAMMGSGVINDLELTTRWGLRLLERDVMLASLDDAGPPLVFDRDLDATVAALGEVVGAGDADRYRRFAGWSASVMGLMRIVDAGPPPSLAELDALARSTLGAEGARLMRAVLAPASEILRSQFGDERLRGALAHFVALSGLDPMLPGTGVGALRLASLHGYGGLRPAGGSRRVIEALERCATHHGATVVTGAGVDRIELAGGRAVAARGGQRFPARLGIVSTIDAARVFGDLMDPSDVPASLREELASIHSGLGNVTEVKIDAIVRTELEAVSECGLQRAMLTSGTLAELEEAFAEVRLGRVPATPPVVIALPSAMEPGWAPDGHHVLWVQTPVPWRRADGPWTPAALEDAAQLAWGSVEQLLGPMEPVHRVVTGPLEWVERHGGRAGNPNQVDLTLDQTLDLRPSPSLARYTTPLAGLYLSGAGTHPGGGLTGAPGRNAAHALLADVGTGRARRTARRLAGQAALAHDACGPSARYDVPASRGPPRPDWRGRGGWYIVHGWGRRGRRTTQGRAHHGHVWPVRGPLRCPDDRTGLRSGV